MPRRSATSRGFGVIAVVTLVTVTVLLAFASWKVYDTWQGNNARNQNIQPIVKAPDVYAGWKTYCHEEQGACFKYPTDWTIDAKTYPNGIHAATLKNPEQTLKATYLHEDTRDSAEMAYYTYSLDEIDSSYRAVGGFSIGWPTVIPEYKIVDERFTKKLVVRQTTTMQAAARLSLPSDDLASFEIAPTNYAQFDKDESKAKAWFETADAKLARLIVKSFYVK